MLRCGLTLGKLGCAPGQGQSLGVQSSTPDANFLKLSLAGRALLHVRRLRLGTHLDENGRVLGLSAPGPGVGMDEPRCAPHPSRL